MNEHELIGSAVTAWMAAKGIELLKRLSITPWVNYNSDIVNKWLSRVVAFFTTLGVHASFDHNAGALIITGLTFASASSLVLEYARQYMLQEVAYKKFIREVK
jgi:hypothetical protein